MSCVSELSCACLAISNADQKLLRWRKELYEERIQLGQVGTSTALATLDRELRELHHLLIQNVLGVPFREEQWLDYSVEGRELLNDRLDRMPYAIPISWMASPSVQSLSSLEEVPRIDDIHPESASQPAFASGTHGSNQAKSLPNDKDSSAGHQTSKPL